MGLCTPCAGTRLGAADPTRSRAAYPPPRLLFGVYFLFFDLEEFGLLILQFKEQSMETRSNKYQTSIKNKPHIDHQSQRIEVWRAPGQVWRRLGPSWAIQNIFGGILDRLGGVLEASWRSLGGLLGDLGPRKVANMAPKTEPKSIKNRYQN